MQSNLSPRSEKLKEQSLGVHKKKQAREKKKTDLLLLTPNTKNTPDRRIHARTTQQIYQNSPETSYISPPIPTPPEPSQKYSEPSPKTP